MGVSFYCLQCAAASSWMNPSVTGVLTLSNYQLEKFVKHTAPTGMAAALHSVFDDPSASAYRHYQVVAGASGYLDRSDPNRPTLCYFAHEKVGNTYLNGVFQQPASGVRVVCIGNSAKIHAFPDASVLSKVLCTGCGRLTPGP